MGVYFLEKVSVFIMIGVLFWPEISAIGVFFNFEKNELMRPLGHTVQRVLGQIPSFKYSIPLELPT